MEETLTAPEKTTVKMFLKLMSQVGWEATIAEETQSLSFATKRIEFVSARKKQRTDKSKYHSTEHALALSSICEQLFSTEKLILTDLRLCMDGETIW